MDQSENVNETLGATMWLDHSPPLYQRLSPPARQDVGRNLIVPQQVSMGYHHVSDSAILWQDKNDSPKHSPDTNDPMNSGGNSPVIEQSVTCYHNSLKRRSTEPHQVSNELERKHIRRDGSTGSSNVSMQLWSSKQVEEYAETLVADFESPLSTLTSTDIAIATYGISEALLALPSLTVFKQEAPSPENSINNPNLNHVSQRGLNGGHQTNGATIGLTAEPDSNQNGNNTGNLVTTSITTTPTVNKGTNNTNTTNAEGNTTNNGNRGRGQPISANIPTLLYNEDYPTASSSGNQVSSSQQGNEFNDNSRFQYVLAAATSIATKLDEETLTYLNQGQSYEIKLKKLGDLSAYRGKILKSSIRICFHERRLQYTEKEHMEAWERARPGERLIEVDVPLSYGMLDVVQCPLSKNTVEFRWDPTKEVGVYIKVNCISTEFTPKKHGGEKGVPFRIQVDTQLPDGPRLHAASCQIKVFKLKGADRKHKQDRDKIRRRPSHEQEKYQTSYPYTMLSEIPVEVLPLTSPMSQSEGSPYTPGDATSSQDSPSPPRPSTVAAIGNLDFVDRGINEGLSPVSDLSSTQSQIMPREFPQGADPAQVKIWLRAWRFEDFESIFAKFSARDLHSMTLDMLIKLCGEPEGLRLYNAIHAVPQTTLHFAMENDKEHNLKQINLYTLTRRALTIKLLEQFNLSTERLHSIWIQQFARNKTHLTDESVKSMENGYLIQILEDSHTGRYDLLLKPYPLTNLQEMH